MTKSPDTPKRQGKTKVLPPLRVSETEREAIQNRAQSVGLSVSEYQRRACLNGKIVINQKAGNTEAVRQLLGIGNNLNQIARSLNKGDHLDAPALDDTLLELRRVLAELVP